MFKKVSAVALTGVLAASGFVLPALADDGLEESGALKVNGNDSGSVLEVSEGSYIDFTVDIENVSETPILFPILIQGSPNATDGFLEWSHCTVGEERIDFDSQNVIVTNPESPALRELEFSGLADKGIHKGSPITCFGKISEYSGSDYNLDLTVVGTWKGSPNVMTNVTHIKPASSLTPVTLVKPPYTQPYCEAGVIANGSISVPQQEGVVYSILPPHNMAPGETTVVKAVANTGHTLIGTSGWVVAEDGLSALYNVSFDNVVCEDTSVTLPAIAFKEGYWSNGEIVNPVINIPTTTGVVYNTSGTVRPLGNAIVEAVAQDGFVLAPGAEGWVYSNDYKKATFSITFGEAVKQVVTPGKITVKAAYCEAGVASPGDVVFPTTPGISYSEAIAPVSAIIPDAGFTVVAFAEEGYIFPEIVEGWAVSSDRLSAEATVTIPGVDCSPVEVSLAQPIVTQPKCVSGSIVEGSLDFKEVEGVTFSQVNETDGKTTLTATAEEGYFIAPSEGWVVSEGGRTAIFSTVFEIPECEKLSEAVLESPIITQPVCEAGELSRASVKMPETVGVNYSLSGDVEPGGKVVITAVAAEGFGLVLSEGWKMADAGAVYEFTIDSPDCGAAAEPTLVELKAPLIKATCVKDSNKISEISVTPVETVGVEYSYTINEKSNEVVVTAKAKEGFALDASDGWIIKDGVGTFKTIAKCDTPTADKVTPTGSSTTIALSALGGGLIAAGLVLLARRFRN